MHGPQQKRRLGQAGQDHYTYQSKTMLVSPSKLLRATVARVYLELQNFVQFASLLPVNQGRM